MPSRRKGGGQGGQAAGEVQSRTQSNGWKSFFCAAAGEEVKDTGMRVVKEEQQGGGLVDLDEWRESGQRKERCTAANRRNE